MWRFKKIVATLLLGTFAAGLIVSDTHFPARSGAADRAGEPAAGSQCAERAKRAVD